MNDQFQSRMGKNVIDLFQQAQGLPKPTKKSSLYPKRYRDDEKIRRVTTLLRLFLAETASTGSASLSCDMTVAPVIPLERRAPVLDTANGRYSPPFFPLPFTNRHFSVRIRGATYFRSSPFRRCTYFSTLFFGCQYLF